MKRFQWPWRLGALLTFSLALSACGPTVDPTPPTPPVTPVGWQDQVIYFAMTDRFANGDLSNDSGPNRNSGDVADKTNPLAWHGGDFAGLKARIEDGYFTRMGFTAIWISPVVLQVPAIAGPSSGPNAGKLFAGYHGYWAEDFRQLDPHFGTLAEYQALVAAAHAHGLKIVQDIVINHAGYGSRLTQAHPGWFHSPEDCQFSANQTVDCALFGLPDFSQGVPEAAAYLNDFVTYWRTTTGIDGLRIDTMKHVPDSYWTPFFAAGGAGAANQVWSVGEVFDGNPAALAHYLNDLNVPSVFDFALYYGIKEQLSSASGNLDAVANVFAQDKVYRDASRLTTFVDNHDVRRFVNEVTARGGSSAQAAERLDLALSLLYFSRGTPSVYQGTEYAQSGEGDPYNYATGQGNREDMDFTRLAASTLDERLGALAHARKTYRALTQGAQTELWRPNGGAGILAYRRAVAGLSGTAGQNVVFVLNNTDSPLDLASLYGGGIPLQGSFASATLASTALTEITGRAHTLSVSGDKLSGVVPARTALALTAP